MSKLSSHCGASPDGLSELLRRPAQAGYPLPGIFGLDINLSPLLAELSPSTVFIFRTQIFGPDNGSMYVGDPVQAGRDWVDRCYPIWRLNPAAYYSLINEPGRNDIEGLTWLCAFNLAAMQRADELGIKLAICDWSTGMPPISASESGRVVRWLDAVMPPTLLSLPHAALVQQIFLLRVAHQDVIESTQFYRKFAFELVDPDTLYINIYTPMLRYAMAHGHILALHEYSLTGPMLGSPLCLRYRELYKALPADARPPLAITEAGPGAGYGTGSDHGYTMAQYVAVVADYDTEVMKDRYVIAACLYHHGKGESDLSEAVPLLTDYIVAHPTPTLPPIGGNTMPIILGPHATSSPGQMLPGDTAGIIAAQKFTGYKFLTGDPPEHYAQVKALGIPLDNCITRLFVDFRGRPKPSPAQFCDEQRLAIQEAMAVVNGVPTGVKFFEVHNEPNLGPAFQNAAEWPYSDDPHDFINWLLPVCQILRANHPGIKLISPGLSPQANTAQWWIDFGEHGVFDAVDAVGAHVYWPNRGVMLTPEQGLHFLPLLPITSASKPLMITEMSNNQPVDPDRDKGLQYIDWLNYVAARYPTLTRAYIYILSSATTAENTSRQSIVRNGVVSEIAAGIAAGVIAAPTTHKYEHSHLDGGLGDTANPRQILMNANHTLEANWTEVVQRFFLTVTISPPGSGTVTLTPPQPIDGYPAGTLVTATFAPGA